MRGVDESLCAYGVAVIKDGGVGRNFFEADACAAGGRLAEGAVFQFLDFDDSESSIACANAGG